MLTVLRIGCGVFFSIRTRFVQFRCFGEGVRNALGRSGGGKRHLGISPLQSLTAAVAAQVGTGNIVGASGAILVGGPGAIFWMWVIASFGMATIYAEAVLAVIADEVSFYRVKKSGGKTGKHLLRLWLTPPVALVVFVIEALGEIIAGI